MDSPQLRVALRALLVGVTSLLVQLQQSAEWDQALLRSAIVAAVLAGLEVFTPINPVVGPGKTATIHKLPAKTTKR